MVLVSLLAVSVLGLPLAWVGPPVAEAADAEVIGVVWRDQATGPSRIRQRLLDALAGPSGPETVAPVVLDRADDRARAAVAVAIPRARADNIIRLSQGLRDATTRFREGDLPAAEGAVVAVLAALRDDPLLPGAAALAFSAEVLHAQILWSRGGPDGGGHASASEALRRAVVLDPDAALSTRRVPPAIATLHATVRAEVLAARPSWAPIRVRSQTPIADRTAAPAGAAAPRIRPAPQNPTAPTMVEIDGRPGQRPVPAGTHFVVVRTPGRLPMGFVVEAGAVIDVPERAAVIERGLPAGTAAADRICEYSGADRLVLVTLRDRRLGMESFVCHDGFAAARYSEPFAALAGAGETLGPDEVWLTDAASAMRGGGSAKRTSSRRTSRLAAETPWPKPKPKPKPQRRPGGQDEGTQAATKPWYSRVWVWALIGGVVAAGVTTGAVLGTREQPPVLQIDSDQFLPAQ